MKKIDIKGKEYVPVNERIIAFRQMHPDWSIQTTIYELKEGFVLMQTRICDEQGRIISTAYAYEKEDSSFINKTSFIENCETSAVGRALGFLGIGVDTSIASFEEVANAINNQNTPNRRRRRLTTKEQSDVVNDAIRDGVISVNEVRGLVKARGKTSFNKLTYEEGEEILNIIQRGRDALEIFGEEEDDEE